MSEKICRAIAHLTPVKLEDGTESNALAFTPENPDLIGTSTLIHPDENGEQWYWTPDDNEASTNA